VVVVYKHKIIVTEQEYRISESNGQVGQLAHSRLPLGKRCNKSVVRRTESQKLTDQSMGSYKVSNFASVKGRIC
jgi:hypothetical protein